MSENITNQNLESHYSTQVKAQRPLNPVAKPPESLPTGYGFSDSEANKKFIAINQDIYEKTTEAEECFFDGVFEKEFEEYFSILFGAEQKCSYKEFFAPVYIMNAMVRSIESGKKEYVNSMEEI